MSAEKAKKKSKNLLVQELKNKKENTQKRPKTAKNGQKVKERANTVTEEQKSALLDERHVCVGLSARPWKSLELAAERGSEG